MSSSGKSGKDGGAEAGVKSGSVRRALRIAALALAIVFGAAVAAAVGLGTAIAFGVPDPAWAPPDDAGRPANPSAAMAEAGFYQIEPIAYTLRPEKGRERRLVSGPQRLFYSFHPAVPAAAPMPGAPLFVFTNGGPGCATTTNLFAMDTAPYTLNRERTGGAKLAANPYSWAEMGNLLYIDAPNTGFSYALAQNPANPIERTARFGLAAYNPYVDAAMVARLLIRFLGEHPGLRASPIILVGESYGGVRMTTLLNYLLYHGEYLEGDLFYADPALFREAAAYFGGLGIDPEPGAATLSPAQMGRFLPAQILIEPQLTGAWQDEETVGIFYGPDSPIDRLAAEAGVARWRPGFILPWANKARVVTDSVVPRTLGRDPYWFSKPAPWGDELEAYAMSGLLDKETLSTALGFDAGSIPWLQPGQRTHAFRFLPFLDSDVNVHAPKESGGLYGDLAPWDAYLVGTNPGAYASFYLSPELILGFDETNPEKSQAQGSMFLNNIVHTRTLLTDAAWDLIIYPEAIPRSLARYKDIVRSVEVSKEDPAVPGSGFVRIAYVPGALGAATPDRVDVAFPHYADAGHAVAEGQPEKFRDDVGRWLRGMGLRP
jgi:hypothetical protein